MLSVGGVALLGTALLVAGCGGEGDAGGDPERVLEQAFSEGNEVESGVLDARFELGFVSRDSELLQTVGVSGPFEGSGEDGAPRFDLAVGYGAEPGEEQDFDLIATEDAGYIGFGGESYTVDPAVFGRFKRGAPLATLEPERWFIDPSNEGTEDVEGTEAIRISGTANVARLLPDVAEAAEEIGLRAVDLGAPQGRLDEATVDAFIGADDRVLRGLDLSLAWHGELEGGEPLEAAIEFSLSFAEANEGQEIEGPGESRPISDLAGRLPARLRGLGEFLSGGPRASGSVRSGQVPEGRVRTERRESDSSAGPPRRCPDRARGALPLGEDAAERAADAVLRREDPGEEPEARAVAAPMAGARGANVRFLCGQRIAERTMVVLVHRAAFDRGPSKSASLGQGVFFVSRFPDGYRTWYSPHP